MERDSLDRCCNEGRQVLHGASGGMSPQVQARNQQLIMVPRRDWNNFDAGSSSDHKKPFIQAASALSSMADVNTIIRSTSSLCPGTDKILYNQPAASDRQ
ncbi:hypothetical protein NC653_017712 [Populus alba x Populus x berolinensis]|uniref:Uncharacterized protein n=1 Tax=Populus alba x Populus x berolinensis TaxID=444605 RepID=A0AAD6QR20_9ROSI|nr:hypothetical protein NC653_017712 [Populus alba x Populus x berolinensis]